MRETSNECRQVFVCLGQEMKLFPKTVAEAYLSLKEGRKEAGKGGDSRRGWMDGWMRVKNERILVP